MLLFFIVLIQESIAIFCGPFVCSRGFIPSPLCDMFTFRPGRWNDSCDQQIYIITVLNPSHPPMLQIPFFCCFICIFNCIGYQVSLFRHRRIYPMKYARDVSSTTVWFLLSGQFWLVRMNFSCGYMGSLVIQHYGSLVDSELSGKFIILRQCMSSDIVALPVCSDEILFNREGQGKIVYSTFKRGILSLKDSGKSSDSRGSASFI